MSTTVVNIDSELVAQAKKYGDLESRNVAEQVEYWAKIGKIAQDNPDLTYQDITEILLGMAQIKSDMTSPYKLG